MTADRPDSADTNAPDERAIGTRPDEALFPAVPEQNFAVRRLTLIALLVAAVVLPCVFVAAMVFSRAVPREPPTWRKNVTADVATPMSRGSAALCMASTMLCMFMPRPMPKIAM